TRTLVNCFRVYRIDADLLLGTSVKFKRHCAVNFSVKSIVAALADVQPGVKTGSPLADQYTAGFYHLAAVTLHSETLGITVTPVAGAAYSFFMSHSIHLLAGCKWQPVL